MLRPHYRAINTRTDRSAPDPCIGTFASRFCRLSFSLRIRGLVPAVPRESLYPTHAPSTPVATRPVIRHPADSSQDDETVLVSATLTFITTRLRRVHFRSSFGHAPARFDPNFSSDAHHHGSLPQQLGLVWDLLLKADPGGPAPIFHAASRTVLGHADLLPLLCSTLSSINTSLAGSRNPCSRIQRRRALATSARCCSAARKLFFNSDVMACEEAPKCGAAAVDSVLAHRRNDLIQRQIRLLSDKSEYPLRMSLQRRNASSAWFWPRNALSLPVLQPSNCGTCADLQLLGGFPPRCSRFNKSNDSYSHFTGIRAAHGSPPKGESMRIDSLPTWPLGIPRFTSAGKRFRSQAV